MPIIGAIIIDDELTKVRQGVCNKHADVTWSKAEIDAASQAVADWYDDQKLTLLALIETATNVAPLSHTFTDAEKDTITAHYLTQKTSGELR